MKKSRREGEKCYLVGVVGREGGGDGEAFELGPVGPPRPELREGESEVGLRVRRARNRRWLSTLPPQSIIEEMQAGGSGTAS
jgi:hypothetical protein